MAQRVIYQLVQLSCKEYIRLNLGLIRNLSQPQNPLSLYCGFQRCNFGHFSEVFSGPTPKFTLINDQGQFCRNFYDLSNFTRLLWRFKQLQILLFLSNEFFWRVNQSGHGGTNVPQFSKDCSCKKLFHIDSD